MNYANKEYEVKKWSFYSVITWKVLFSRGDEPLVGEVYWGEFSLLEGMSKFLTGQPPISPVGKTLPNCI